MARFVEDLALALPILSGPSPGDPFALANPPFRDRKKVKVENLRVVFHTCNGIVEPTPATQNTVKKAANALDSANCIVDEKRPPRIEETYDLFASLMLPGAAMKFQQVLEKHGTKEASPLLDEAMVLAREYDKSVPTIDPEERDKHWRTFNQAIVAFMSDYDVMLCPVNAYPAMKHGTTWGELKAFSYGMTYNLTGHPAAVVRCGTSPEGFSIGVQVVGQMFREDVVLAVAEYLESEFGGWQCPTL